MLSLMGFLEPGVGSDTISDFTTKSMTESLAKITHDFCRDNGVALQTNNLSTTTLPIVDRHGRDLPFILIPRDVLRDLPVTDSWSDVWQATEHNEILRQRVSKMLAGIFQPTIVEQKEAIKKAVTQSSKIFDEFLKTVKSTASSYDENDDVMGYYSFRKQLNALPLITTAKQYDMRKGPDEIRRVIHDALDVFRHHVENGNLWEALWAGNQPKRERASQLLFYAIADAYCRSHDIDLSNEPNMGGGPVDFKFSQGYNSRVIVEMKKSTGSVQHGYQKQLIRYRKASQTDYAIFVVIVYDRNTEKIARIQTLRQETIDSGKRASDIYIIDATKKSSASKDGRPLV